jgi:dipeptidyl aminopeptidase/acylaminoacyl peptidase
MFRRVAAVFVIASASLSPIHAASPAAAHAAKRPPKQYTIGQFMATTSILGASFSRDEKQILFSSNKSGIFNVYSISAGGGEPAMLTHSTTNSVYAVSYFPKDDRMLITHDQGGNENNHLYVLGADGSEKDLTPGDKVKAQFIDWTSGDKSFYASTNERDPRFFDIYRYDADGFARTLVYQDETGYDFGAISNDGRWLAFGKSRTTNDSDVFLYDVSKKEMKKITPHTGSASNRPETFDPASHALYFLSNDKGEFAAVRKYDLASGETSDVEKASWDIASTSFSRHGRYRVTAVNDDGSTVVRLANVKSGQPVPLPKLPDGEIRGVEIAPHEDRMAFYVNSDRSPNNLYVYDFDTKKTRRLTSSLSPEIDADDLAGSTVVRFKARDGMTIPSIFYKPLRASAAQKVPAVLFVHGGPGGQTRKGYSSFIQFLVNHGYAVLGINNRGSSGYGKTFFAADDLKHGHEPLEDCVDAKKYLTSLPYIDGSRIGIVGGSYGGYMVLAALAFQPEVFDAGVDLYGVSNWLRTLQSIPPYWESERLALYAELGDPTKDEQNLRAISPLFHAELIRKPLIVFQGANDPRVLKAESDEIVVAVKKNNVPVEYVVFAEEGHGFTKKADQMETYSRTLTFLDKYLKGKK